MKLAENTDILIVGGGVIGLSLARELRRRGVRKISIVEKNPALGAEASHAAAGMLAPQAEADSADEFFVFCRASRDLYPQFARELFEETGVDIELDRAGTLYLAFGEKDVAELEMRYEWQRRAQLEIEKLTGREILELEPEISPAVSMGLLFPGDWQVENRRLIKALEKSLQKNDAGGEVRFIQARVRRLSYENNRIIGAEIEGGSSVRAGQTIIASGAWTSLIEDEFRLLENICVKPVCGQMAEFKSPNKLFRRVIYTQRGYLVPRKDCRILVGATVEDRGFDKSLTTQAEEYLKSAATEISRRFSDLDAQERWAGLRPKVADGLPIIGKFPDVENLFIATAHYRNGILLAPLTARILADEITGAGKSEFLEIFSPQRLAPVRMF